MNVENLRSLRAAAHRLAERCPVIARAVAIGGTPPWRCDEVGYPHQRFLPRALTIFGDADCPEEKLNTFVPLLKPLRRAP